MIAYKCRSGRGPKSSKMVPSEKDDLLNLMLLMGGW